MIAAIDPGYTNLGYAFGYKGELTACGTLYFKDKDRLKEIYLKVSDLFIKHKPERVLVEDFRVYREDIKGKHKTALAMGVVIACAYDCGADVELVNHNTWKAKFRKTAESCAPFLEEEPWKSALKSGSEHSRDAVKMLLPEVVSLKRLLMRWTRID